MCGSIIIVIDQYGAAPSAKIVKICEDVVLKMSVNEICDHKYFSHSILKGS